MQVYNSLTYLQYSYPNRRTLHRTCDIATYPPSTLTEETQNLQIRLHFRQRATIMFLKTKKKIKTLDRGRVGQLLHSLLPSFNHSLRRLSRTCISLCTTNKLYLSHIFIY